MFIPIGDEPNPRITPVVTYALIAINVAVFVFISWPLSRQGAGLGQLSDYDLFLYQWGFRPAAGSIVTIFTSIFLHGGWGHLLGNMLFLWIFGDNVEHHLGRSRYLMMYLGTGVAATLFFAMFKMDSQIPLVGASGAISGILGCYYCWFPRNNVRVLMVVVVFIQVITIPARWVLLFYLVIDNILPVLMSGGSSGVAHGAHIGGFIAGVGVSRLLDHLKREALRSAGESEAGRGTGSFGEAIEAQAWDEALEYYGEMGFGERRSVGDWDVINLADGLTRVERFDAGLAVLQRFIGTRPNSPVLSLAHLRAGLIQLHGLNRGPAAYQHLLAVLDLEPPPEVEKAARENLSLIESQRK